MRLTLRTLLAYMDDILDPVDQQDLGKKIETSDFATDLIHRSRDVVRRLRLSAPEIDGSSRVCAMNESSSESSDHPNRAHPNRSPHGNTGSIDPNMVAEYLDNTLAPEEVAEYERICLESDIHLAEVASCHHILTMVLGEPAEVGEEVRQQLYRLPELQSGGGRLRIEPSHGISRPEEEPASQEAEPLPANRPQAATQAFQTNDEQSVPDYLRKAAQVQRRNKLLWVASIVFMGIIGYFMSGVFLKPEIPESVANMAPEAYDQIDIPTIDSSNTSETTAVTSDLTGTSDLVGPISEAAGPTIGASPEQPSDQLEPSQEQVDLERPATFFDVKPEGTVMPKGTVMPEGTTADDPVIHASDPGHSNGPDLSTNPVESSPREGASFGQSEAEGTSNEPSTLAKSPVVEPVQTTHGPGLLSPDMTDLHQPEGRNPSPPGRPLEARVPPGSGGSTDPVAGPQASGATSTVTPGGLSLDRPLNSAESVASDLADGIRSVPGAPQSRLNAPGSDTGGILEETMTEPADKLAENGPVRVGNYLGSHDILLHRDELNADWVRVAPRSDIFSGHQLLSMPTFTAPIMLGGINASLSGGTQIAISQTRFLQEGVAPVQDHPDLYLEVIFGRILMGAGLDGSDVVLKIDDHIRRLQLAKSANLALEVQRTFVPGTNIEQIPAPIVARFFLTHGSLEWSKDGTEQTIEAPAVWEIGNAAQEFPRAIGQLPDWIDGSQVTTSERLAQTVLLDALAPGEPIAIRLQELTDPNHRGRKREVRTLAARCGMYVGEFEPLVKALNDPIQRAAWDSHIDTLRQAMALSPDVAKRAREAFVAFRGEEATNDLMRMVQGYSSEEIGPTPEAIAQGAIHQLIRFLDSNDLDFRVLAYYNLREITGKSYGGYQPGHNANQRKRAIRIWLDRLESGEILPVSAP